MAGPLDYSVKNVFPILECKSCRNYAFTLVDPDQSFFETLYASGNYDLQESNLRKAVRPLLDALERLKANWLYRLTGGGRLLEIGCGKGRFLLAAHDAGFDVAGIEPAERSYKFARQCLGDKVVQSDLQAYTKTHQKSFDVVVLWHVFEHIPSPITTLNYLKELLKDDGCLILAMPNWKSIQSQIGRSYWYHLDPPRHLHHFTPSGLKTLLEQRGIINISIFSRDYFQDFLGDAMTLLNLVSIPKNVLINSLKLNRHYIDKFSKKTRMFWLIVNAIAIIIFIFPIISITILSGLLCRSGTFGVVVKMDSSSRVNS